MLFKKKSSLKKSFSGFMIYTLFCTLIFFILQYILDLFPCLYIYLMSVFLMVAQCSMVENHSSKCLFGCK